ncbi:hypothetical protein Q4485_00765 [Granulosicoccaceae sp. 1_MG-2023]|nr:hypothetical protein [Granulosicoccaceae sp. 1_MG-2023]
MPLLTFRNVRILALLLVLAYVALYSRHQLVLSRAWERPLAVTVFPINGDGLPATRDYIASLDTDAFREIDRWFADEGKRYGLEVAEPVYTETGPQVDSTPPVLEKGAGPFATLWWGLKMRYWAWQNTPDSRSNVARVRLFVIYHQGREGEALPHSLGLQKGLIGVVHAFAERRQARQNRIVIAHELLHTVGATDKYDARGLPVVPDGLADPSRQPVYPQRRAEIMAGHIAVAPGRSTMAGGLSKVVINPYTALEINWIKAPD